MAVTTAQHFDVSQALATALAGVGGARVYAYVADTTRPAAEGGAIVIGLPSIDWSDEASTFCWATFDVPLAVVTLRNNDRAAQQELSRLVRDVAVALQSAEIPGVFDVQMLDARPGSTTISGAEYPSYTVRVQVRA